MLLGPVMVSIQKTEQEYAYELRESGVYGAIRQANIKLLQVLTKQQDVISNQQSTVPQGLDKAIARKR